MLFLLEQFLFVNDHLFSEKTNKPTPQVFVNNNADPCSVESINMVNLLWIKCYDEFYFLPVQQRHSRQHFQEGVQEHENVLPMQPTNEGWQPRSWNEQLKQYGWLLTFYIVFVNNRRLFNFSNHPHSIFADSSDPILEFFEHYQERSLAFVFALLPIELLQPHLAFH